MSALRAFAWGRRFVPRSRRLGYALSELAAAEIPLVASQVCGPEAEGRGFPRPGRRRVGQREGKLDLAGCTGGRIGRHDIHRHLEIALLRPRARHPEDENRTYRIPCESLHDAPPACN